MSVAKEPALVVVDDLAVVERKPGWYGRCFHSANMTFVYYRIDAGAAIHAHRHPQEEVWHVIEGELEVTVDGQTLIASSRSAAIVPSNADHAVRALVASSAIVVDHPRREGFEDVHAE